MDAPAPFHGMPNKLARSTSLPSRVSIPVRCSCAVGRFLGYRFSLGYRHVRSSLAFMLSKYSRFALYFFFSPKMPPKTYFVILYSRRYLPFFSEDRPHFYGAKFHVRHPTLSGNARPVRLLLILRILNCSPYVRPDRVTLKRPNTRCCQVLNKHGTRYYAYTPKYAVLP